MPTRDIIVLGTSMGGVDALKALVRHLPANLPASVFVVQHIPDDHPSRLPELLTKAGPLPAEHARDGESIQPGRIYVAPPGHHLLLQPGHICLSHGARENRFRPAIDPLFRSAARHYGARVIGVLLTGGNGDGEAGLMAVRAAGGLAVVQDPEDAYLAALPREAIALAGADFVVPLSEMAPLLTRLVQQLPGNLEENPMTDPIDQMPATVDRDMAAQEREERRGLPSVFSCPECGGVLWQVDDHKLTRFRCHVGHAYYAEHLLKEQADTLEEALWTCVRILRERATLSRLLVAQEQKAGKPEAAARFREQAEQADRQGSSIHDNLLDRESGLFPPATPAGEDTGAARPTSINQGPLR